MWEKKEQKERDKEKGTKVQKKKDQFYTCIYS